MSGYLLRNPGLPLKGGRNAGYDSNPFRVVLWQFEKTPLLPGVALLAFTCEMVNKTSL